MSRAATDVGQKASVALLNGRILTLDDPGTVVEALAISGDRIVKTGATEDIRSVISSTTHVIDLDGRTVTPGYADCHAHVELASLSRHTWLDLRELPREETLERIAQHAATVPRGQWIVVQGTFTQDLPTREELDRAAPDHPLAMRWTMHRFVVNSLGLAASGISRESAAPVGVRFLRSEDGDLSGVIEDGWDLLGQRPAQGNALREYLRETLASLYLQNGVTSVYELPASADGIRCYQQLARDQKLPVRLRLQLTIPPGHQPIAPLEDLERTGLQSGFGNEWLRIGGIKIFADGWHESGFDLAPLRGRATGWGLPQRTYRELANEVSRAMDAGLQVWIHCGGDLAREMGLSAIEEAALTHPGMDHRSRIEHIGNDGCSREDIERLKKAGIIPVPNPGFMYVSPADLKGPRTEIGRFCVRSLRGAGLPTPGNSDHAGTQPLATNPWFAIQRMVVRDNLGGDPIDAEEAVSIENALRCYTTDAAYASFEEHDRGSLEVGKLADMVVLSDDPYCVEPTKLQDIRADITLIGGDVVHERTLLSV